MTMNFQPFALAALIAATGLAQAQSVPSRTTLNFTAVDAGSSLSFSNVIGTTSLTITPLAPTAGTGSNLKIKVVDINSTENAAQADEAIGVQVFKTTGDGKVTAMDNAFIEKNQSLLFTFSQAVRLTGFNMDYPTTMGASQFTLSVDGGAAQSFSVSGSNWLASGLVGTTFEFGVASSSRTSYAIDSISLASVPVTTPTGGGVVAAVPEPETYALMAACLGVLAVVTRRRKA